MRNLWAAVGVVFLFIVLPSGAYVYWYTHNHPVYLDSLEVIRHSPDATRLLGSLLEPSPIVWMKISEKFGVGEAEYRVSGERGTAKAIVSAVTDGDDRWEFRYVWLKPERGKIVVLVDNMKKFREQGR